MKDIKIDVDFKDTCIDFGKYVQERISSSTVKWNIPSLWEAYQDNMNKEVRDLLTDEGNGIEFEPECMKYDESQVPPEELDAYYNKDEADQMDKAEEFYKDHFGHTSQHVSMDKIFVCMELYARHQKATQEIKQK
jgi:tRNA A37 threonylcarbamoyladenosine dehydratase